MIKQCYQSNIKNEEPKIKGNFVIFPPLNKNVGFYSIII